MRIRKHKNIYTARHRRGSGMLEGTVIVLGLAAIAFVGWSIYGPIVSYLNGKSATASVPSRVSSQTTKSQASSSKKAASSAPKPLSAKVRGVYLPKSYLSDSSALGTLIKQAGTAKINLAVIDVKAEDGIVNYNTGIPEVKGTAAVAQGAADAKTAVQALSAAGITPAARICAFQDPVAPTVLRDAAVKYAGNHSYSWLDAQGNRWLNPYSDLAKQYITDLAKEAVSLGFKQIYIDGLTFPTSGSPDKTGWYGDVTATKEQALTDFAAQLTQQINAAGGKVSIMLPGSSVIGQASAGSGQDQSLYSFSGDYYSPNLSPALLGKDSVQIGGNTIAKPDLTPGGTVTAAAQYLKGLAGGKDAGTIPLIQAYTAQNGAAYDKQYTADDINAEISAVTGAGMGGFVLYSPTGQYDLSGIK